VLEFGCFVDDHGKPAGSSYYVSWDCKATTYTLRGSHLLLFTPGFIEVRNLETGTLLQVIRAVVRSLRPGMTERGMLVAAMNGNSEQDGTRGERLVELV
jgi:RHO1 GDP-GTP exchange protein 1/2